MPQLDLNFFFINSLTINIFLYILYYTLIFYYFPVLILKGIFSIFFFKEKNILKNYNFLKYFNIKNLSRKKKKKIYIFFLESVFLKK